MASLSLQHITKRYPNGFEAVKDFNLEIADKEFIIFVGPSGCGKSTLLKSLNRMNDLVEGCKITGKVTLDGDDIYGDMDVNLLRKRVGMVFQHFNLFPHKTILENVTLAPIKLKKMPQKEAEDAALELLRRVGIEDKASVYPSTLSGGQKQRVAIARAMVNNPKILLADEPTGALDSKSGEQIMELFQKLNEEGVTIVMITHDPHIASNAKRMVKIIDGEIFEGDEKEDAS